ncbi:MAG: tetratricopeptide repeat protein [Verrucomicrobiales bacterium]|nr:tetratricopeptide repeat protein [Verrucomicrobiales bacterium]
MPFCARQVFPNGVVEFIPRQRRPRLAARSKRWSTLTTNLAIAFFLATISLIGAELEDVQKLYLKGEYEEAASRAQQALDRRMRNEDWGLVLSQSLLALGRYSDAQKAISNALELQPSSVRLRVQARDVYLQNGQIERAKEMLDEINQLGSSRMWAYNEPKSLLALGRAALIIGADPKLVLENFFNRAKSGDPKYRETYLAIGQLALDKYDDDLAAKTFQEALKECPNDPDILCSLARAYASSDRLRMIESIESALEQNARHTPTLLLKTDHMIDAEQYDPAAKLVEKVLSVNPAHPEAWAYRAVLAHLHNKPDEEKKARAQGLQFWKTNPRVDHLIGLKLSQKYRFVEGSAYQRRALESDPQYLPARLQLSQDLLRLGDESEGWSLAEGVHKSDAYDVVAYNLVTLHDTTAKYHYVTNENFSLRMTGHEAHVYGQGALHLLQRARAALCEKYEFKPDKRTLVEIFPEQKDFAIRTFMMPGGEGFLAVCFGNVITANSPASQNAVNWHAVLWHEFCHVVTLGLTKNKMPRWLSEGISVYEERQANPAWGQSMTPKYREMILDGELTAVGNLSAAFLTAKTPMHVQFAYYESSLVVEYLVQKFGLDALKKILRDLGAGVDINAAIAQNTAPMEQIEKEFSKFAKDRAEQLGQHLEWTRPQPGAQLGGEFGLELHPNNYYRLTREAKKLLSEKKWLDAKVPLQTLLDNYPEATGPDNAWSLLAAAEHGLKETDKERETLAKLASIDSTAIDAYARLMEIAAEKKDWNAVTQNAERFLAVNPLVALPYQYVGRAAEEVGQPKSAIAAYQTLLQLDPADPAETHFRLGKLLRQTVEPGAKRHVLQALEDAPRYREALRFLLELNTAGQTNQPAGTPTKTGA